MCLNAFIPLGRQAALRVSVGRVLTDYHLHLRPDDLAATAGQYFTSANFERYREVASERGISELGVSEHIHRFTASLEIWQHPFWIENATDDLAQYECFVREQTDLKFGIEMDFVPGRESATQAVLERHEWDFVIGSVHFLRDRALDHDAYDVWHGIDSADKIWRMYFEALAESARSGMFDIIAHPDLVKYWGNQRPAPDRDPRHYYEPAIDAFLDAGVSVEFSTAGLRKPVGEFYPSPAFLEMIAEAELPIALSSDAHEPGDVGYRYSDAIETLRGAGIEQIAVFDRRRRTMEQIG